MGDDIPDALDRAPVRCIVCTEYLNPDVVVM
jgi:hypothetical protein